MFKVNNKDTKTTPMASFWCLIVNFEHISHLCSSVSIVNFEQINVCWEWMRKIRLVIHEIFLIEDKPFISIDIPFCEKNEN